jgi:integrase
MAPLIAHHGPIMALTHSALQALKPRDKNYAVSDRDGLFIEVLTSGAMVWRYKYRFAGKREKLTIGPYPAIGLAQARTLRNEAAALLALGQSPAREKQSSKARQRLDAARATRFEELAQRWFAQEVAPRSAGWQYNVQNWLKLDIYPALGQRDPRTITRDQIDAVIQKVVKRGAPNSAAKVQAILKKIFQYAEDEHEVDGDPTAKIKPVKTPDATNHRPLAIKEIKPFLLALDADEGRLVSKLAIRLLMLTLTRKDELRLAKWPEFDLDNGIWEIPGHRMKGRRDHLVFLSRQVIDILEQLKPLSYLDGYIFPGHSTRSKPIGHTTINSVIDRLEINGGRFVPHGFRATASTIFNEAGFRHDAIERQLAHVETNRVRAVYNKAEYAQERQRMLQWWADYIDSLKQGSNVIPLKANRTS